MALSLDLRSSLLFTHMADRFSILRTKEERNLSASGPSRSHRASRGLADRDSAVEVLQDGSNDDHSSCFSCSTCSEDGKDMTEVQTPPAEADIVIPPALFEVLRKMQQEMNGRVPSLPPKPPPSPGAAKTSGGMNTSKSMPANMSKFREQPQSPSSASTRTVGNDQKTQQQSPRFHTTTLTRSASQLSARSISNSLKKFADKFKRKKSTSSTTTVSSVGSSPAAPTAKTASPATLRSTPSPLIFNNQAQHATSSTVPVRINGITRLVPQSAIGNPPNDAFTPSPTSPAYTTNSSTRDYFTENSSRSQTPQRQQPGMSNNYTKMNDPLAALFSAAKQLGIDQQQLGKLVQSSASANGSSHSQSPASTPGLSDSPQNNSRLQDMQRSAALPLKNRQNASPLSAGGQFSRSAQSPLRRKTSFPSEDQKDPGRSDPGNTALEEIQKTPQQRTVMQSQSLLHPSVKKPSPSSRTPSPSSSPVPPQSSPLLSYTRPGQLVRVSSSPRVNYSPLRPQSPLAIPVKKTNSASVVRRTLIFPASTKLTGPPTPPILQKKSSLRRRVPSPLPPTFLSSSQNSNFRETEFDFSQLPPIPALPDGFAFLNSKRNSSRVMSFVTNRSNPRSSGSSLYDLYIEPPNDSSSNTQSITDRHLEVLEMNDGSLIWSVVRDLRNARNEDEDFEEGDIHAVDSDSFSRSMSPEVGHEMTYNSSKATLEPRNKIEQLNSASTSILIATDGSVDAVIQDLEMEAKSDANRPVSNAFSTTSSQHIPVSPSTSSISGWSIEDRLGRILANVQTNHNSLTSVRE